MNENEKIELSPLVQMALWDKLDQECAEVVNIRIALHPQRGVVLLFSHSVAATLTFDHIMGEGWQSRFIGDLADVLGRDKELAALLERCGKDIVAQAERVMKVERGEQDVD